LLAEFGEFISEILDNGDFDRHLNKALDSLVKSFLNFSILTAVVVPLTALSHAGQ